MLKLNLGCGYKKMQDFVNVDKESGCQPDMQVDLAKSVWPWQDNTVAEANFELSLEQMGETREEFLNVFKELYRVCAPNAKVNILTYYPRHDSFVLNPLCLHPVGLDFLSSMSFQQNMGQLSNGIPGDYLSFSLGVNFQIVKADLLFAHEFEKDVREGKYSEQDLRQRMHFENNICQGIRYELVVGKSESPNK